jgi:mycobactin lysine-N-oxygenase
MQALASLAVVGAGPKGLAIAAKRAALARSGREVPDLVLIDRAGVATNWSGTSGYTDGRQPLSTPPEKDVGFPYAPSWGPASGQVSDQVRRWSWQRYLIDQGGLADWVDRGQPRPDHRAWHRYLRWVAGQLGVEPVLAEVVGIDLADGCWRLSTRRRSTGEPLTLDCDGLVLTGPGAPLRLPGQPDHHPRILDGRSFWTAGAALSAGGPVEVCVVGSGETAGSITSALVGLLPEGSVIELVSDHGVLYTRGESFTENRMYSDPDAAGWRQLAERHRREFLKRTDRGVFSVQVQDLLDRAGLVRTLAGRVTHLEPVEAKVVVEVDYDQRRERLAFDWVVGGGRLRPAVVRVPARPRRPRRPGRGRRRGPRPAADPRGPGTGDRPRPGRPGPAAQAASADPGRARPGPGVPQPLLPRPARRPGPRRRCRRPAPRPSRAWRGPPTHNGRSDVRRPTRRLRWRGAIPVPHGQPHRGRVQLLRVLRAGPGSALPAVTAVLAGALASIGAYGLLRFEAGLRW